MVLLLTKGERVDQRDLLRRLTELQYTRNDIELHRGTYRMRGESLDIFPADSEDEAVRVEFFDKFRTCNELIPQIVFYSRVPVKLPANIHAHQNSIETFPGGIDGGGQSDRTAADNYQFIHGTLHDLSG